MRPTSREDEQLITLLAAHAAVAIANAAGRRDPRALDRRRAEPARARPARRCQPEALRARARGGGGRDAARARAWRRQERVGRLQTLAREARSIIGSLVFELRPPDLARDGLGGALRKHVEVLRRLGHEQVELVANAPAPNEVTGTPTCSGSRRRRSRMRSGTRAPAGSSSASAGPTAASSSRSRTTVSASTSTAADEAAQARLDLDGGACPANRRHRSRSARRLASGRPCGSRRMAAEPIRVLRSTTTPLFAPGCAARSSCRTGSKSGTPRTRGRASRLPPACARTWF